MDYAKIELLLEKYWEGETSIQEETVLREYFNQPNVAEGLKEIQPMFQYFQQEKSHRIERDDFDEAILSQLETTTIRPLYARRRGIVRMMGRVAAVALIVLSVFVAFDQFNPTVDNQEISSIDDLNEEERLAYEQTRLALSYLSSKLNKGANIAATNVAKVHKTTDKVFKNK